MQIFFGAFFFYQPFFTPRPGSLAVRVCACFFDSMFFICDIREIVMFLQFLVKKLSRLLFIGGIFMFYNIFFCQNICIIHKKAVLLQRYLK